MNEQMQYGQYNQYGQYVQPVQEKKGLSLASMILGIVSLLAWCLPILGFPVCITGLILGIIGIKKGGKGMAIAGIIMCAITLLLTLGNSILGVIIGMSGSMY